MIDHTNITSPGWRRVVADLTAPAPDDKLFLLRLLNVLGQVSSARQGVLFTAQGQREDAPTGVEPRAVVLWPLTPDVVDAQGRMAQPSEAIFDPSRLSESSIEQAATVKAAARACAASRQTAVYGVDGEDQLYDAGAARTYVIAVPIAAGTPQESATLPLHGVVTMLVDSRTRQALQTTLAVVELLSGYVFAHTAQQILRRTRASTAALDLATRLIASINNAQGFKGAAIQFVNDLCRQASVDRVALGWVHGVVNAKRRGADAESAGRRGCAVVALSDTENLDRRMAVVQKIEPAMNECLDQEQPVLYPPPPSGGPGADAVLSQAITHAHRDLASGDARLKVASLPLRVADTDGERLIGVVLVESTAEGRIDVGTIELLQATLDLVAPVLRVRFSDDRSIAERTADWGVKAAAWAVGPRHTLWKAGGVLLSLLLLFVCTYTTPYRIGATMELQPRERRTISSPFDGVLLRLGPGIEPGAKVARGQVLAEMDTTEMKLSRLEAISQVTQYEKQADDELKKNNLADYQQALAKAEQSRARADLLENQIARSAVVAPIDGTIIAGDLKDKIGASIKLGDTMFELADLADMKVVARVDDSDISLIRLGQTGDVSPKADPGKVFPFVVERIVPLSVAKEGKNSFEVQGKLAASAPWFRPGMEGRTKFNGDPHSLAWIATRRVLDTVRVWVWW